MKDTLGANIKALRKKNKMTLKTLASRTGFSISFLSQLERGKSSATLESLKKISLALGVNPGYFFDEADEEERIVRSGAQEREQMEKHNIYYKSLAKSMDNPAFSPLLVVLKPDQNEGNLIKHSGQEFLYVLEGQLTVQIGEDIYVLNPSESIMFDSSKEHYWYNYTDEDVKFLCVGYDEI
ncbi:helix-turn-helix domain-containing protein [Pseudogracilibacillus sp. SO30301A]|uniref:helix-turn-helix domain-containing protein n=1 Tax=Pseudogracilibacillus sp. SO30301A TaxID=3098291 RepID=UPI00300DC291